MTRRSLLLASLGLCAQSARPRVSVEWMDTPRLPASFARESLVFPRAYVASPDKEVAQRALECSLFPHAFGEADASLSRFFEMGDEITVMTARSSDGDDSPFDRSIHVPLAIRWPGRLQPREMPEILVSHVDVLPTLMGLTGIQAPAGLQGRDLSPLILKPGGEVPEAIYCEGRFKYSDEWRCLVRGFDKVIWNLHEQVVGLYNLADDPREGVNLKDNRQHELTRDSMMALARVWMRKLTDGMNPAGLRIRR